MREFFFGAMVGAITMYLYLEGFGPLVGVAESWWLEVSAPHRSALQH